MDLIEAMMTAIRSQRKFHPWRERRADGVMLVDDLHFLTGKPACQREVGRLFRIAVEGGARVAGAACCEPEDIPDFIDTLRTIPGAQVVRLRPPSAPAMRRILAGRAMADELAVDDQVLRAIATWSKGDVRRGLGALALRRFAAADSLTGT